MLFVVCGFYMQERVEQRVLHAYGLTVLCYGALLYVEELEHLRRPWLWKGVLVTIPLHIAFVASLFWWDAKHPQLAHSGFMFVYALLVLLCGKRDGPTSRAEPGKGDPKGQHP